MATTVQFPTNIRPFHVDIPDEKLADLRRRIAATRWPSAELVNDSSQGVQSKMLQKLARYWEEEHDWRKVEIAVLASHAEKKEPVALDALAALFRRGYFVEMPEHPQTIGYALTDTPVGLAAWMLDHDEDSYEKISHAFLDGNVTGGLTPERVVDNITLYWLTNTAASSARLYWENFRATFEAIAAGKKPAKLAVPGAFTVFPSEIFQAPRSWAEKVYPNLIYFHEAEKGGHFAAWEQPEIFARELRAAFSSLR